MDNYYSKLHLYFLCTCSACPEQYDVYKASGELCGYIRLRWSSLYASYPNIDGDIIYSHEFEGDFKGAFLDEEERKFYIKEIANAYKNKILKKVPIDKDKLDVEVHFIDDVKEIHETRIICLN